MPDSPEMNSPHATPGRPGAASLAAIYAASVILRWALGGLIPAPAIFDDEWSHWEIARSLAAGEGVAWSGRPLNYPCWAYPLLLSIPARLSDGMAALAAARFLNACLVSLTPLLAFALAHEMGERGRVPRAAILAAALPALGYSPLLMAESLYYPLFMLSLWLVLRSMKLPSPFRCLLAGAACGAAFHVKPQGLYLPILYAAAVFFDQAIELRAEGLSRPAWRAFVLGILRHSPAAAGWALALAPRVAALASDPNVANPFTLDAFLGRYSGLASGEFVVVSRGVMPKMALAYAAFGAIGAGFIPAAAPFSAIRKGAPREFRQGALLAGLAFILLAALSVWLIGGRRVHERFVAASYPALIACFCASPDGGGERGARRAPAWLAFPIFAALAYTAFRAGRIMDWFLAADSPSGAWMLFLLHPSGVSIAAWICLFVPLIAAAIAFAFARRRAAFVFLVLIALNVGWYAANAELAGKQSASARLAARKIHELAGGREKLLILADGLGPRILRHAGFLNPGAVVTKTPPRDVWFAYQLQLAPDGAVVDPLRGQSRWLLASPDWKFSKPPALEFEGGALYDLGGDAALKLRP